MSTKSVFQFLDYKGFLKEWIASQPNMGRGLLRKMADYLSVHPTLMSQVINGKKDLSNEQAFELAEFLEFSKAERRYFLLLVHLAKSGNHRLRSHLHAEAEELRAREMDLKSKFQQKAEFTDEAKAEFYSDWSYSAVRLATDIQGISSVQDISRFLDLPVKLVEDRIAFLIRHGLCQQEAGRLKLGATVTHVPRTSPFSVSHHRNWRLKALSRLSNLQADEFVFTAPVSISSKNAEEIFSLMTKVVDRLKELVEESKGEKLMVMNLDWFKLPDKP